MFGSVSRFTSLVPLVALVALLAVPAQAEAQSGRITGVVQNARGLALEGATVTVTNQATNRSSSAASAADGRYTVSGLAAGTYTVMATMVGMQPVTRRDVVVSTGPVTVDLVLQVVTLQSVTVTAMLREQALQDVPFSVAAPSAEELRERGADDLESIANNVAGFNVQNLGPGQNQVAMRGASAGQIARDQPGVKEQVGSYLDETVISLSLFTPDLDLFDVGRVEVLRGPQGTLFGSGSTSGTVRYITNQPTLGAARVFGEVGGNMITGGGPGGTARLGTNQPLGSTAALRAVGYFTQYGGYMDAVQPGGTTVNDNVNSGQRFGGRVALSIVPNEKLSITPRIVYQNIEMDGWNRIDTFNILANPYTTTRPAITLGGRRLFTQIAEPFTDQYMLGDLRIRYDFGAASLTSITAYSMRDILVVRDAGALTSSITGGSVGLAENVYTLNAPLDDSTSARVVTQEVRLAGSSSTVDWVVGGYFTNSRRDYSQILLVSGFEAASGIPTQGLEAPRDVLFYSDLGYDLTQVAAFGEATVALGDQLRVTGGLRYYNFTEDREQTFDGIFGNDDNGTLLVEVPGSASANGFAPRFMASFAPSDAVTLNAQASRGIRLGGINDPLNVPLCTPADLQTFSGRDAWSEESVWNFEAGAKTLLAGGRASLNVSAFNMDIRDLQLIVTAGSCSSRLVFNVPRARSQGLELEITASPSPAFDLAVSGAVNNAQLRSTLTSTDAGGATSVVAGIQAGNRLPSVPKVQGSAAATYRVAAGTGMQLAITGSVQYVGSRITQIDDHALGLTGATVDLNSFAPNTIGGPLTQNTFTFDTELPAYSLVNARIALHRGDWEFAVYGRNLGDTRALLALDRERGTRARVGYLTNQPRTIGVTVGFNY